MHKYIFSMIALLTIFLSNAQVQMADDFRGEGKIYVVLAIILFILAGFFFLLFKLDRKSKRLHDEINKK